MGEFKITPVGDRILVQPAEEKEQVRRGGRNGRLHHGIFIHRLLRANATASRKGAV